MMLPHHKEEDTFNRSTSENTALLGTQRWRKQRLVVTTIGIALMTAVILGLVLHFAFDWGSSPRPTATNCDYAIVGTGAGGIYAAWRLVTAHAINPSRLCIFEAHSSRIGGRMVSATGPGWQGQIVDLGAYRFDFSQLLIKGLVVDVFNLPITCYTPGTCTPSTGMHIISRQDGKPAGYRAVLNAMLQHLTTSGVRHVYMDYELLAVKDTEDDEKPIQLIFSQNRIVKTGFALLNLAPHAVRALDKSPVLDRQERLSDLLDGASSGGAVKQYLHYPEAWWITHLNLTQGYFSSDSVPDTAPISGRYHETQVECNDGQCAAILQARYIFGDYVSYFVDHTSQRGPILTLQRGVSEEDNFLLDEVHSRIMEIHSAQLEAAGVDVASIPAPLSSLVSLFDGTMFPFSPSTHDLTGDKEWLLRNAALYDIGGLPVFLANEAYADLTGWAEGSLAVVERMLKHHFGLDKPTWIDAPMYWNSVIRRMPSQGCNEDGDCEFVNNCSVNVCDNRTCVLQVSQGTVCDLADPCSQGGTCNENAQCMSGGAADCPQDQVCVGDGTCREQVNPPLPACHYHDDRGPFELYWEFVGDSAIRLAFSLPATVGSQLGWFGLGFGSSMGNTDMIYARVNRQQGSAFFVEDRYSPDHGIPRLDAELGGTDDLRDVWWSHEDGVRTVYFERDLNTGDEYDATISPGLTSLVYAYREDDNGLFAYHVSNRYSVDIDLSDETLYCS